MRLLVLTNTVDKRSGWGRMSAEIVGQLPLLGLSYTLGVEHGGGDFALSAPHSLYSIFKNCITARRFAKDCDAVHALDVWPYALYGWAACFATPRKLFISGVGTYSVAPLYKPLRRALLRVVLMRASAIFCISAYTLREIEKVVPLHGRGVVVHMGATTLPEPSVEALQNARTHIQSRGPVVLTVGGIDKEARKGQLDTLKAVEVLRDTYPSILYVAVGSAVGSYADKIRSYSEGHQLENNFCILDNIRTDEELAALYASCDIFALNSQNQEASHHFEGFGLVFLEAYQFGKPAVGSRNCGIEDAISDGVTGYLTNQGDIEDIALKIGKILSNKELFLESSIKSFRSNFDWAKTAKKYSSYYTQDI